MKTIEIVSAYAAINEAKLTKMEDSDKFLVIKAIRELKPIAEKFEDFVKDAREKLKGEDFEDMQKKLQLWQEKGDKCTLSDEEKNVLNNYFNEYSKKVDECVKEESEKENELSFKKISEDAFGKMMSSNDWNVNTTVSVQDVLCE